MRRSSLPKALSPIALAALLASVPAENARSGIVITSEDGAPTPESLISRAKESRRAGATRLPATAAGTPIVLVDVIRPEWLDYEVRGDIGALGLTKERVLMLRGQVPELGELAGPCIVVQQSYWDGLSEIDREALVAHENAHIFDLGQMRALASDERDRWLNKLGQALRLDLGEEAEREIRENYRVYREYVEKMKAKPLAVLKRQSLDADSYESELGLESDEATVGTALELFRSRDDRKRVRFLQDELNRSYRSARVGGMLTTLAAYFALSELYARFEEVKVYRRHGVSFDDWVTKLKISYAPGSDGEVVHDYIVKQMRKLWDAAGTYDLSGR